MSYPKWVQRSKDIGPVLCLSENEEKQLLADWEEAQAPSHADEHADEPVKRGPGRPKKA